MKKKYRIIIDVTGEAPVVEAESVVEAEEKFAAWPAPAARHFESGHWSGDYRSPIRRGVI